MPASAALTIKSASSGTPGLATKTSTWFCSKKSLAISPLKNVTLSVLSNCLETSSKSVFSSLLYRINSDPNLISKFADAIPLFPVPATKNFPCFRSIITPSLYFIDKKATRQRMNVMIVNLFTT